jgi:hypothetical protein
MIISDKLRGYLERVEKRGHYLALRKIAHKKRKKLVAIKGSRYVDSKKIKEIKRYAKKTFGSAAFWPYLALYTEIREGFIPGWIPEDYYRINLLYKYNPESASLISGYKSFDDKLFNGFSLKSLIYCISGNLYNADREGISLSQAESILKEFNDDVIIKPELGKSGRGIRFEKSSNINVKNLIASDFLIQPVFKQHEELKKIHPESLNTVRVFTALDNLGNPTVIFTTLKFGVRGAKVDNVSSGGGLCKINEDGSLEPNYYNGLGICKGEFHPDTGISMNQIRIPGIREIKERCKSAHRSYPYVKFIGWDVAVGEDESPVLIEWNARYPVLWIDEAIYGPFWNDLPK